MYIYHYSNTDINGNQGIFFPQGVKSEFCGSDWEIDPNGSLCVKGCKQDSTLPCPAVRVEPAMILLDLGEACLLSVPLQRGSSWPTWANLLLSCAPEASSCGERFPPDMGGTALGREASMSSKLTPGSWQLNWVFEEIKKKKETIQGMSNVTNHCGIQAYTLHGGRRTKMQKKSAWTWNIKQWQLQLKMKDSLVLCV